MYQNFQYNFHNSISYKSFRSNHDLEEKLTYKTAGCSDYSAAIAKEEPVVIYSPKNNYFNRDGILDGVLSYDSKLCEDNSIDSFLEKTKQGYSSEYSSKRSGVLNSYRLPDIRLPQGDNYLQNAVNSSYVSHPDVFVKQHCPVRFVDSDDKVQELVQETFSKLTGRELSNISIKICDEKEMQRLHPNWHSGILGFSLNLGVGNMVFVKKESIERLLITIGHEIGHVVSPMLSDSILEEAKAFAFEFAWVKAIKEHDIGGLANCLRPGFPAENGLHDKAFGFVLRNIRNGQEPFELHNNICKGLVKAGITTDFF